MVCGMAGLVFGVIVGIKTERASAADWEKKQAMVEKPAAVEKERVTNTLPYCSTMAKDVAWVTNPDCQNIGFGLSSAGSRNKMSCEAEIYRITELMKAEGTCK
jgi:hypothetical protein